MKLRKLVCIVIDWGVSLNMPPVRLAALFAATVIIRNLLEAASMGVLFEAPAFYFHFPVAYVFPMLGLVALMHSLSGFPLWKLLKLMIITWTLTLLPPIIDLIMGVECDIGYFPLQKDNALWFLTNFFNPTVSLKGTTAGIRIEAFLGCVLAGVFTWCVSNRQRILRGVITTVAFMPVFLVFFTWPYLVQIIGEAYFPLRETTQRFLEWRVFTEAPLYGTTHFTVFIIDMIPVTFLAAWFIKRLKPSQWIPVRNSSSGFHAGAATALAGTITAFAASSSGGLTFADSVSLFGALTACIWILASASLSGTFKTSAMVTGFLLAWASGWNTFVALSLAVSLLHLPGPGRIRRALAFPVLFFAALSPAGFPVVTLPFIIPAFLALLVGVFSCGGKGWILVSAPMLFLSVLVPVNGLGRGMIQGLERQTDSLFRSGMFTHAHASATTIAASGGGFSTLARTASLSGMTSRAQWAYRVGTALGDSSPAMKRVGINLAYVMGDSSLLWNRTMDYIESGRGDAGFAMDMVAQLSTNRGDISFLSRSHAMMGLSDRLLILYSRAYLAQGDSTRAVSHAMAAVSSQRASPAAWAWAVELAGITGGDYDSLFVESRNWYHFSLEIALARLNAGIVTPSPPDMENLLERCLVLYPHNVSVLETASAWHLASGNADLGLEMALRALAAQMIPRERTFLLAIRAAESSDRPDIADACEEYARGVLR